MEETPETTSEDLFRKHHVLRALGATEDDTVLNAHVAQGAESEDALGVLEPNSFSISFSSLRMHENDV